MDFLSSSDSRVMVWTTLLHIFPFLSRSTRSSSREPFSMVKIRLSWEMVVSSQPVSVVLPEEVAPATVVDTPYLTRTESSSIISSVAVPDLRKSSLRSFCAFTIRIDAATPTSSSTRGVFSTAIRIFLERCPRIAGEVLSSTIPDTWSIRRTTLIAWSGDSNFSSILTEVPLLYCTSISSHEFIFISSMPVPKMYFVRKENSAISVYRASISSVCVIFSTEIL